LPQSDDFNRHLCICVDVQSYSSRDAQEQKEVQGVLKAQLEEAARASRLDRVTWMTQDQGDGQLALVPVGPDEPRVLDDMVRHLDSLVGLYNRGRMRDSRMRLRLAFHSGVAYPAALGFAGPAVVAASRLVQCDEVRAALIAADDANLVVIVSPTAYEIVTLSHTTLDTRQFRRVEVRVKEYRSEAWIWVPGSRGFRGEAGFR
jgi:hypothetical protein